MFSAYDTISFHGKHFLVPEHSLRFQHEGTCLNPDIRERLWPYMGGIAKQNGMIPKLLMAVSDHVHLLVTLPTRLAVAKAVQLIKAGSSAWIHQTYPNLRTLLGNRAMAHSALVSRRFGPLHRAAARTSSD